MDTEMPKKSLFTQLKKNKTIFTLLIIAILIGVFLRFDNYAGEGYNDDCSNTIPAAVFTYYPHDYFPGLVSTEPPLGNYIIGLGCMASGEDFSGVSNVKPLFFPDRSSYLGSSVRDSEKYCFIPVYLFGLIFIIGSIVFAFSFFKDIRSATYFVVFTIFFKQLLEASRIMKVDIFLFTFIIFGLAFLWKFYDTKKGLLKEKVYIFLALAFLGMASATKFPAGALVIFSFLLILEKYLKEILFFLQKGLKQLDLKLLEGKNFERIETKSLFSNLFIAAVSSFFFLIMFFDFKIKNLKDTYHYMTSLNWEGVSNLGFSIPNLFSWFVKFLISLNIIDIFIFLFSLFIIAKLIFRKNKTKQEKFALYMVLLCVAIELAFKSKVMISTMHALPFMFGFFIFMSLAFSDKKYSIFNTFNIKKKYFSAFLLIYIVITSFTLFFAPFHHLTSNPIVCSVVENSACEHNMYSYSTREIYEYFDANLKEDETFLPTGIINYYIRHNDDILWWSFFSGFSQQVGQEPRLDDYVEYYKPEDRRLRYVYTDTILDEGASGGLPLDISMLKKDFKPNHIITIHGIEAAYIFDLDNLVKN